MRHHNQHYLAQFGIRVVHRRRGSTLVVIIALMAMLSLLGVVYFTFASQERENAENFLEASKHLDEPDLGPDIYFDWILRQITEGPTATEKNSPLWGKRHSLLANMFGVDSHPYTGRGIVLRADATGTQLFADQDLNGIDDLVDDATSPKLLEINDSPSAHARIELQLDRYPAPDVDYTYPDINNSFLAYLGYTLVQERDLNGNNAVDTEDTNGNGKLDATEDANSNGVLDTEDLNGNGVIDSVPVPLKVHKPSFHRPELLRNVTDWYTNSTVAAKVMRAHPSHVFVPPPSAPQNLPTVSRYLNADNPVENGLLGSGGFQFRVDNNRDGTLQPLERPKLGSWDILGPTHPTRGIKIAKEFDLDEDNDNDGVYEGVLIDGDFPVQEDSASSGKLYIPMFSVTIVDSDGLFNLNAHGNLSGNLLALSAPFAFTHAAGAPFYDKLGAPYGDPKSISRSLHGLTSYEVNPIWGLTAQPGALPPNVPPANLAAHATYFGATPSNWYDLANMEFWWLNKGRVDPTGAGTNPKTIAGRLGEADRTLKTWQVSGGNVVSINTSANANLFSYPGIWDQDDNRDRNEGGQYDLTQPSTVANMALGQTIRSRHPLSYGGNGLFWFLNKNPAAPANDALNYRQLATTGITGNPTRWVGYTGYQMAGDSDWRNLMSGSLMLDASLGAQWQAYISPAGGGPVTVFPLFDDMSEITLDHKSLRRPYDEPFTYEDTAVLHLSEADGTNTSIKSRMKDLAPANFNPGVGGQATADIRKRFTSESWDRKQFGLPLNSAKRPWEFNHDSDQDGLAEFPPAFPGTPLKAASFAYSPSDPFRAQLRRLLAVENGNSNQLALQLRLGLNQILDVQRTPQAPGNPFASPLTYRPLTPHPTSIPAGQTIPNSMPVYPPQTAAQQEWWARYDRQSMARDIYVMLATFCRGDSLGSSPVDPTQASAYATPEQQQLLTEMAQFAANLVDALDRDNIMTRFEFDLNLSNGWALDDDATTTTDADRAEVIGVERQEIAFSETLWAYQAKSTGTDNPETPFDETVGDVNALFVELRNLQPEPVALGVSGISTGKTSAVWRIRRSNSLDPVQIPVGSSSSPIGADENAIYFKATAGAIQPGAQYTLATGDAYLGLGNPVDLYMNTDTANDNPQRTFELIAPKNPSGATPTSTFSSGSPPATGALASRCDLDLVVDSTQVKHELETGGVGSFLDRTNPLVPTDKVQLILERRQNPLLPQLPLSQNPWVAVDYMHAIRRNLGIGDMETPANILANLQSPNPNKNCASRERRQPLDADLEDPTGALPAVGVNEDMNGNGTLDPGEDVNGNGYLDLPFDYYGLPGEFSKNSLNQRPGLLQTNSNRNVTTDITGQAAFRIQQLHFDRDLASPIEMFYVPLSSPKNITRRMLQQNDRNSTWLAGLRFFRTDTPTIAGTTMGNHWHRLLSFVEIPTHSHRQLGDAFVMSRVPGKVNLNTIRFKEMLAGLVDCPEHVLPGASGCNGLATNLPATVNNPIYAPWSAGYGKSGGSRDLWADFLVARDGMDPISQMSLPGIAAAAGNGGPSGSRSDGSRPFRDLALDVSALPNTSVEGTILRGQLADQVGTYSSLDEADQRAERLFDIGGTNDPYIRQRLLSKIMGNTTTRSNVFFVYITVRFHEVYEDTNGNQRIGGRYDLNHNGNRNDDAHRGFFILDRSAAEEAYNVSSATFDWRQLVKYRLTIN